MEEETLLMNLSVFLPQMCQEQGVSHSLLVFALGFEWGGFTDILSISAALSQHALKVGKTGTGGEPGSTCFWAKAGQLWRRKSKSIKSCKDARENIKTGNNFFRVVC